MGGGGTGRGGEEKVALGCLESWEVAAAGFASLRACVRERARELERSERAPAMPIRPRLAAPGRGARPDSLRPGPARRGPGPPPPAPGPPLPPPRRPQPPARPGSALLSRPPLSLPPGRGAAWRSPGSGRAAARRPSEPGSGAAGRRRPDPRPRRARRRTCPTARPLERRAPLGPLRVRVPSINPGASRAPGARYCPGSPARAWTETQLQDLRSPPNLRALSEPRCSARGAERLGEGGPAPKGPPLATDGAPPQRDPQVQQGRPATPQRAPSIPRLEPRAPEEPPCPAGGFPPGRGGAAQEGPRFPRVPAGCTPPWRDRCSPLSSPQPAPARSLRTEDSAGRLDR